ncbi:LURP1-like domain [Macleaya cordata]|uniref:LURP1-like domain n=1 Tax=Macleaya cordata TaxID=56857 RepID=A0A200R359_MACCD|nr:LURP1-like domain [Macleaya cordata]
MPKVYPNATASESSSPKTPKPPSDRHVEVLTVWKKSLLFNCNGFTVFDTKGNLVFRVDNYLAGNKAEIVLMDASGKSLLTIRRKKLSFGDTWMVYDGETCANPRFLVKKQVNFLKSKILAHVTAGEGSINGKNGSSNKNLMYEIEGSYGQRCVAVYDNKRRVVAEIKKKEAIGGVSFGCDVFRLIVQPELDPTVAMTLVILLEQMFGSRRSSF